MATALLLKQDGNKAFSNGDYKEAETLYTKALTKDPSNAALFTNRAFARLKLSSWDACIDDCLSALSLSPDNMKAYHRLAQAQLALRHPNEALSSALRAYELCIQSRDRSAAAISTLVLDAKKQKWEARERERMRRRAPLVVELEEALEAGRRRAVEGVWARVERGEIGEVEAKEEVEEVEAEARKKVEEMRSAFAVADADNAKRREVPDYMIDAITFAVMQDPVITKRGQSYERATIEQHLLSSPTDPLTREPLTLDDLRPNLALKAACEEFLKENGWAVDW